MEKELWNFWDLSDCRHAEVTMGRVVGDMPESVEDGTKDFGWETLDAMDVGWLG